MKSQPARVGSTASNYHDDCADASERQHKSDASGLTTNNRIVITTKTQMASPEFWELFQTVAADVKGSLWIHLA